MRAEVVSVGTELLLGSTIDTNAPTLGQLLAECGIDCSFRQTVGDNLERATHAIRQALDRSDCVITIGGLGPTEDDLTRNAIAASCDVDLELQPEMLATLKQIFESRNLKWVDSNQRQAMLPVGGQFIDNPFGTAAGIRMDVGGKIILALPGPPREFKPMLANYVKPLLAKLSGGSIIHSKVLRVCGMGESRVEDAIKDLLHTSNPSIAPYAKTWEVHLRLTARAQNVAEAEELIRPLESGVRQILGAHVYGTDETTLEMAVGERLAALNLTVSAAESCSAGLLMSRLAAVPGASRYLVGGAVTYTVQMKIQELGVPEQLIEAHSPVSEQVAEQMAIGARKRYGTDYALAITGVAGPGPDDRENPEGLVYVALAGPHQVEVEQHHLGRGRDSIRMRASQAALTLLWRRLNHAEL